MPFLAIFSFKTERDTAKNKTAKNGIFWGRKKIFDIFVNSIDNGEKICYNKGVPNQKGILEKRFTP